MPAKRRLMSRETWSLDAPATPSHLSAADPSHREVASPAVMLQARLGAALATSDNPYATRADDAKWSAPVRLTILLGSAVASWVIVWKIVAFLI